MYVHEVASDDFLLVKADWPAEMAAELIAQMYASYVIVHRHEPPDDYYYLHPHRDALDLLRNSPPGATVREALDLHETGATDTREAFEPAEGAPDRAVVLSDGQPTGFLDFTLPPTRGPGTGTTRSAFRERGFTAPVARALQADFPEQVPLDTTASLLVSLSGLGPQVAGLPVALPAGSQIDVVVQPQQGFALEGPGEARLTVTDDPEPLPHRFPLRATEAGPGRIRVLAFHEGSPLGALALAPTVTAADAQDAPAERRSHESPIEMPRVVQPPDLQMLILEGRSGGNPAFTIRLTAADPGLGLYLKPFGPVELRMDPLDYFEDFFQGIEDLPLRTAEERQIAEVRLASKGLSLFNALFPDDLKVLLWELRERITTIEIESEEPWIPWELCRLEGKENDEVQEGPFLCQGYAITRWIPGIGRRPSLSLNRLGLVVPADSNLPFAPAEREYMLSLAGDGRQVEPVSASFLKVRAALASGNYDGWHFSGHGLFSDEDPNRSGIQLEGGIPFTPDELSGEVKNLGRARPLVFLNACQIGRSALSLTDVGGFAPQFLRAGAAAFIGSYWSIFDQPALEFARNFYDRLLSGDPISQAAKTAREMIRPLGDPTWLAYTVYADPTATVA